MFAGLVFVWPGLDPMGFRYRSVDSGKNPHLNPYLFGCCLLVKSQALVQPLYSPCNLVGTGARDYVLREKTIALVVPSTRGTGGRIVLVLTRREVAGAWRRASESKLEKSSKRTTGLRIYQKGDVLGDCP